MDPRGAGQAPPRKEGSSFALTADRAASAAEDGANAPPGGNSTATKRKELGFWDMVGTTASHSSKEANTGSGKAQSSAGRHRPTENYQDTLHKAEDSGSIRRRATSASDASRPSVNTSASSAPDIRSTFTKLRENAPEFRASFLGVMTSMVRYSGLLMCTWEVIGSSAIFPMVNGGPAAFAYSYVLCFIGSSCIAACIAELASIMPVSGGQMLWTWMLAPKKCRKFLSYFAGHVAFWTCQAMTAGLAYCITALVLSLAWINGAYWIGKMWVQLLMLVVPCIAVSGFMLSLWDQYINYVELFAYGCHVFTCTLAPIVLLLLGKTYDGQDAITMWTTIGAIPGEWTQSRFIAFSVGAMVSQFAFLRIDGPCYKASEMEHGKTAAPKAMLITLAIEGLMGLFQIVTFVMFAGPWVEILNGGYITPLHMAIFYWSRSLMMVLFLTMPMLIHFFEAICGSLQNSAMQLHGLALQDAFFGGVKGNRFFREPNAWGKIPQNYCFVVIVALCISLMRLGTHPLYRILFSMAILGTHISYGIPIGLLVYCRIKGTVKFGPFRMRSWLAYPVYTVALLYAAWSCAFACFPNSPTITWYGWIWGPTILFFLMLISVIYYFTHARHLYNGPKESIDYLCQEKVISELKEFDPNPRQVGVRSDGMGAIGEPIVVPGYKVPSASGSKQTQSSGASAEMQHPDPDAIGRAL